MMKNMNSGKWRLDEYIPCLDLYLRRGAIGESHMEVQDVARLIGRSPAAVALRLANFQYVDPNRSGPGLDGGAKQCQQIWDALIGYPKVVEQLTKTMYDLS